MRSSAHSVIVVCLWLWTQPGCGSAPGGIDPSQGAVVASSASGANSGPPTSPSGAGPTTTPTEATATGLPISNGGASTTSPTGAGGMETLPVVSMGGSANGAMATLPGAGGVGTGAVGGTTSSETGGAATAGVGAGGTSNAGASGGGAGTWIVPVGSTPDERHFLIRDEGRSQLGYVDLGEPQNSWYVPVPTGREIQLIGGNRVLVGTENGWQERSMTDGAVEAELATFPGTVAARRLRSGNTLLVGAGWQGEAGIALLEVDASGVEQRRVVYSGFDYVRLVRPTPSGNYLVTSDVAIFEGDADGNVVWQVAVQDSQEAHAWKALRLPNGETVVATGYEASLQFFDGSQQFLRRLKGDAITTPNFYCDFQVLANGNYVVTNWQGHGESNGNLGRQIVELDPQGNTVWSWQQDAANVSSVQAAILLDGLDLDKLHVEDTTGALVPVD